MNSLLRNTAAAFAIGLALGAPVGMASANSDSRDFQGTVDHVAPDTIGVSGIESGKRQTLGFVISPRVTKFTENGGTVAAEIKDIRPGDTVKVQYEQKFLGLRHADTIIDQTASLRQKS